jgi:DNA helicase TIP49 (TBP-interacting protein)
MNYYLVDYENVGADGIKDFDGVAQGDTFVIFYSENRKNITIDIMEHIASKKLQFKSFKVETGTKNALDFQLSSYLGYLIGAGAIEDSEFYIVSNDKGFDCLCNYWSNIGVKVRRRLLHEENVSEPEVQAMPKPLTKKAKKSKVENINLATLEEIKAYLSDEDEPEEVLAIFNQYKSGQAICNGLSKRYKDTKRASAVYKKLKPLLKEKAKS